MLHKLRSLLTALGIMFGVGAVIVMVAIGEGNKRVVLAEIRALGATNVIVRSVKPPETGMATESRSWTNAYGIERIDLARLEETLEPIKRIVPLKRVASKAERAGRQVVADTFGTTPELAEVTGIRVARGRYITTFDLDRVDNIAVIGDAVAKRLFPLVDPLGEEVRLGDHVFKVVGVLHPVGLAGGAGAKLVGRDLNFDIHIPLSTAKTLYSDTTVTRLSGTYQREQVELHELIIEAASDKAVISVAAQAERIMDFNHKDEGKMDTQMIVPLELLERHERAALQLNALMTAIAAISLLIGGIGIMNIMLATVTERTREIGIRRALGATRVHIIAQFLVETAALSSLGGLIGVAIGLALTGLIGAFHENIQGIEQPYITALPMIVSFGVASAVGIVFGLYPAIKAAAQDPIVALRHD